MNGNNGESAAVRSGRSSESGGRRFFFYLARVISPSLLPPLARFATIAVAASISGVVTSATLTPAHAQEPPVPENQATNDTAAPRPWAVSLKAGLAVSSALLEDSVGPGASVTTATPDLGPLVALSGWIGVRSRMDVELELAWSGTDLGGEDAFASWTADDLTLVQGAVLLRLHATPRIYGRAGIGVIRYSGSRPGGILEDDAQVQPYATGGVGAHTAVGSTRVFGELSGQVHRFSFRALREAGGSQGLVWRGSLQVGAALPMGGRP